MESAADLEAFLSLPERLYVNDPMWVPPLRMIERRRLAPSNPMFADARMKLFLAEQGDVLVGTISVLKDRNFQKHTGQPVVWFGYLEAVSDPAVMEALFARATEQARQWGGALLRGPRNITRLEYIGLTVEGFATLPPVFQAHHPPWYRDRVEGLGFVKHHDMIAYDIAVVDEYGDPVPLPDKLASKAAACDIDALEVRRARWRTIGRDLNAAYEVFDHAYRTVPDTSPMPRAQFLALGRTYLAFTNTEMLQLATVDGRPAGFAVCMPEINEALWHAGGRVAPGPILRFGMAAGRIRTAAFKLIGVLPEFRGTGLHAVLISNVIDGVRRAGYTRLDASVINESNKPMRAVVEGAGCVPYRRYRIYERPV